MKRLLAALVVAVVAVPPIVGMRDADAKCAQPVLVERFVATDAKGAVIVSTVGTTMGDAKLQALTFTVDGKRGVYDKVVHAPGLIAYRLPAGAKKGVITGGKKDKATVTAMDPATPVLGAPKVKTVVHEIRMSGRGSSERTTVTIDGDAPADAVAIVITAGDGKALSWGAVAKGEALTPYFRGRCGILPDGTVAPTGTAKVFWVDKYGRASALSATVNVTTKGDDIQRR